MTYLELINQLDEKYRYFSYVGFMEIYDYKYEQQKEKYDTLLLFIEDEDWDDIRNIYYKYHRRGYYKMRMLFANLWQEYLTVNIDNDNYRIVKILKWRDKGPMDLEWMNSRMILNNKVVKNIYKTHAKTAYYRLIDSANIL